MFEILLALAAMAGGLVASIAGFGVGSILTPLLAMKLGMKVAVAAVAIPHVVATAVRFWALRKQLDRRVFWTFGVTSAVGGLIGAVLHIWVASRALSILLAVLLMFTGLTGLLGITLKFGRKTAWAAGGLSGMLGGLVGNQGGIRAGAMLGFDVPKEAFVATSTAVGLFIDGMRVPVYLYSDGRALLAIWPLIAIATVAVVIGTLAGRKVLGRISESVFKRVVSVLILVLGISMLFV